MWYVIQTTTGKEQELVSVIHGALPRTAYELCFVMKRRLQKRLGGKWTEVTETLFPSYLFLVTERPEKLFCELKQVPEYTKLLGDGEGKFIPLEDEETEFLEKISCDDGRHTVALSKVYLRQDGTIRRLEGPLEFFRDEIIRLNLRKRYAVIKTSIAGRKEEILLGIMLEKDS